jgi:AcrR family transcriptional regulator
MNELLRLVRTGEPESGDRGRILDAALAAFLDFGIRRTSMGEVAKRGGLSPATLYRRYAQKTDLVQAVGLREVRRFLADVDQRVDRTASAEAQIVELFVACLRGLRGNRLLARLLATEPEVVLPMLTVAGEPVLRLGRDFVAEFIERLQAEGRLPEFEAEPVAELVARTALSMALTPQTCIPAGESQLRRFAREHIVLIFRIRASAEATPTTG